MTRINHTGYYHDWSVGDYKVRRLSRSFETLEEAQRFADGKDGVDIYRCKGKFKVEWIKKEVIKDDVG